MATPRELYFRNVLNENFHGRAFLIIIIGEKCARFKTNWSDGCKVGQASTIALPFQRKNIVICDTTYGKCLC